MLTSYAGMMLPLLLLSEGMNATPDANDVGDNAYLINQPAFTDWVKDENTPESARKAMSQLLGSTPLTMLNRQNKELDDDQKDSTLFSYEEDLNKKYESYGQSPFFTKLREREERMAAAPDNIPLEAPSSSVRLSTEPIPMQTAAPGPAPAQAPAPAAAPQVFSNLQNRANPAAPAQAPAVRAVPQAPGVSERIKREDLEKEEAKLRADRIREETYEKNLPKRKEEAEARHQKQHEKDVAESEKENKAMGKKLEKEQKQRQKEEEKRQKQRQKEEEKRQKEANKSRKKR